MSRAKPRFERVEGVFALAAWEAETRTAWLWNDQPSCLNLYLAEQGGALWATTSALVLARCLGLPLDARAACELLARGTVLAPRSMFAGLRRLDLGEHVRYRAGDLAVRRHWSPYRQPDRYR